VVNAFFDTSAVVPLILREPHSLTSRRAWDASECCIAWKWLRVETEAALVRRQATATAWNVWQAIERSIHWVEPTGEWLEHLRVYNRGVGLRAADAAHLYVMERCAAGLSSLLLVSFDEEMNRAASQRGLNLFEP